MNNSKNINNVKKFVTLYGCCLFLLIGCASSTGLMHPNELARYSLKDGIYEGEYWIYPFISRAKIMIYRGKIHRIRVEQLPYCPLRTPEKEWMIQFLTRDIIANQSPRVLPVEEAENPSYFMLQAIQKALEKAIKETLKEEKAKSSRSAS